MDILSHLGDMFLVPTSFGPSKTSVSQPPGRGSVPVPDIDYAQPREILLELMTNLNVILCLSTCHTLHISVLILFMIMPQLIINTHVSLMCELTKNWKGTDG